MPPSLSVLESDRVKKDVRIPAVVVRRAYDTSLEGLLMQQMFEHRIQ
jgi:hypothetical protein